jgi:serine protease AprX
LSRCPKCAAEVDPALLTIQSLNPLVEGQISRDLPGWRPGDGICPACAVRAARAFARTRSVTSLHTSTVPATTFPYYHIDEETVLGLSERLPDYTSFDAHDVTIAFLDSGYYPHPDLCNAPLAETTALHRLTPTQWRAAIERAGPRLVDYADLTADRRQTGLDLPSLWDGHPLAWHGQMTTSIAAGNGSLSDGRFRGFASGASILPVAVGRGDGRIPESDILRGLEWLLERRRLESYGVRVLNISIGGDFPQDWLLNPVCQAVERLAERGVTVVAAAGNRGRDELVAPAQSPSVVTVGGIDDENRLVDFALDDSLATIGLFSHNYGTVIGPAGPRRKPEVLATARWLASPVLPVSAAFKETIAVSRLRSTLREADSHTGDIVAHWQRVVHHDDAPARSAANVTGVDWTEEVWQAVRKRMNSLKWVHPYYQHVDGTSVAAAVVSAVAAQMVHANPNLMPDEVQSLLRESAQPLRNQPDELTGAGLIQPAAAVAAALRTAGGPLTGHPRSGTVFRRSELRKWIDPDRVPMAASQMGTSGPLQHVVYFGYYDPLASAVSVTGEFNDWRLGTLPLQPASRGWWRLLVPLPDGDYLYRFWVERKQGPAIWIADPESSLRCESGYREHHSRLIVE